MYGLTLLKVIVAAQSHGPVAAPPPPAPVAPVVASAPVSAPAPVVAAPAPAAVPAPAPVVPQAPVAVPPPPTTTTTVPSVTVTVQDYVVTLTWISTTNGSTLHTDFGGTLADATLYENDFLPLIGTSPESAPTGYTLASVSQPVAVSNSVTTDSGSLNG